MPRRSYRELLETPHAVYRCWDADDVLLYVGCAVDPEARWHHWCSTRDVEWPRQVARREAEWFDGYAAARDAEDRAIQLERPVHNRNQRTGVWTQPGQASFSVDR